MMKFLIWTFVGVAVGAAAFTFYQRSPPGTFNPLCTYDFAYREVVTLEVGGKQYTSTAVSQVTRSANWAEVINKRGCLHLRGDVLPFRLMDNRLILIGMGMCQQAFRKFETRDGSGNYKAAMREHRRVDIAATCSGLHRSNSEDFDRYDAFLIDNAERPTRWRGIYFQNNVATFNADEHIKLVSAVAEADDAWPQDQLDKVAPAILKTRFVSRVGETPRIYLPELIDTEFFAVKDPQTDTDRVR